MVACIIERYIFTFANPRYQCTPHCCHWIQQLLLFQLHSNTHQRCHPVHCMFLPNYHLWRTICANIYQTLHLLNTDHRVKMQRNRLGVNVWPASANRCPFQDPTIELWSQRTPTPILIYRWDLRTRVLLDSIESYTPTERHGETNIQEVQKNQPSEWGAKKHHTRWITTTTKYNKK